MSAFTRAAFVVSSLAIAALQYLDVAATWLVLRQPGGRELDGATAFVLAQWGFTGYLVEKTLCAALCACAFYLLAVRLRSPRLFAFAVALSGAVLFAVVWFDLHNVVYLV